MGSLSSNAGSILLEGVFATGLIFLSVIFACELCRRGCYEIALQHASFLAARASILGEPKVYVRQQQSEFLEHAFGTQIARKMLRQFAKVPNAGLRPGEGKVHVRFPTLFRFLLRRNWKHHFEITKSCRFPSS